MIFFCCAHCSWYQNKHRSHFHLLASDFKWRLHWGHAQLSFLWFCIKLSSRVHEIGVRYFLIKDIAMSNSLMWPLNSIASRRVTMFLTCSFPLRISVSCSGFTNHFNINSICFSLDSSDKIFGGPIMELCAAVESIRSVELISASEFAIKGFTY